MHIFQRIIEIVVKLFQQHQQHEHQQLQPELITTSSSVPWLFRMDQTHWAPPFLLIVVSVALALYVICYLACCAAILKHSFAAKCQRLNYAHMLYFFLSLFAFARVFQASLFIFIYEFFKELNMTWWIKGFDTAATLGLAPYFSAYSLIVFRWYEVVKLALRENFNNKSLSKRGFILANVFVYVLLGINAGIIYVFGKNITIWVLITMSIIALISFTMSISVLYYGARVLRITKRPWTIKNPDFLLHSNTSSRLIRTMYMLTLTLGILFCMQSITELVFVFIINHMASYIRLCIVIGYELTGLFLLIAVFWSNDNPFTLLSKDNSQSDANLSYSFLGDYGGTSSTDTSPSRMVPNNGSPYNDNTDGGTLARSRSNSVNAKPKNNNTTTFDINVGTATATGPNYMSSTPHSMSISHYIDQIDTIPYYQNSFTATTTTNNSFIYSNMNLYTTRVNNTSASNGYKAGSSGGNNNISSSIDQQQHFHYHYRSMSGRMNPSNQMVPSMSTATTNTTSPTVSPNQWTRAVVI